MNKELDLIKDQMLCEELLLKIENKRKEIEKENTHNNNLNNHWYNVQLKEEKIEERLLKLNLIKEKLEKMEKKPSIADEIENNNQIY